MPNHTKKISSAIITIGDEILLGQTINTNLSYLASQLALLGAPVVYNITVRDRAEEIMAALDFCVNRFDVVISTGGLGPTADDITKASIASFFGVGQSHHEDIWQKVQARFAARGIQVPLINRNQALVPDGFTALPNDEGTAPGLFYRHEKGCFFALAGVPVEMRHVFERQITPTLKREYPQLESLIQKTVHSFGISESALAEDLDLADLPAELTFAWLPQTGRVDLRLSGYDLKLLDEWQKRVAAQISDYVWGFDEDSPASVLASLLKERGLTMSAAESCTGGLIMKMLSDEPGASDYLLGGVVSYSNEIKKQVLGVSGVTLEKHGAVSEECAFEMLDGIKRLTKSDVAVSVTGIAGPSGGSNFKPVGTVYIGFSYLSASWVRRFLLTGNRQLIRHKAAEMAILHMIKKIKETQ